MPSIDKWLLAGIGWCFVRIRCYGEVWGMFAGAGIFMVEIQPIIKFGVFYNDVYAG